MPSSPQIIDIAAAGPASPSFVPANRMGVLGIDAVEATGRFGRTQYVARERNTIRLAGFGVFEPGKGPCAAFWIARNARVEYPHHPLIGDL